MQRTCRKTMVRVLLGLASVAAIPGSAWAAGSNAAHVKVFLRLDSSGRCASKTPGIAEVFVDGTVTWDIVHVKTAAGSCPPNTRVEIAFPKEALGNFAAPAVQPAVASMDENTFVTEKTRLDAALKPADRQLLQRFASGAARAPGGETRVCPAFSSRITAKAIGTPGLYKYNVRVVGGLVEDPPVQIIPPP